MITNGTSATAWDVERNGLWLLRPGVSELAFYAEGQLALDAALSVSNLDEGTEIELGAGGLCLVPTAQGASPVIWASGPSLLRWDGSELAEIDLPGGPAAATRRMYNKWTWNEFYGVCMGMPSANDALWIFKPGFAS